MAKIVVTHYSDPGCPFAYSASPALAVLRWRYRDQLDWRLVTIGLAEDPQRYLDAGYTPTRSTLGQQSYFRRFGMPLLMAPRERVTATSRACRAIVATRLLAPGREHEVLRALQIAWFTTPLLLDQDPDIAQALERVAGLDAQAIVAAIDEPNTISSYEKDKLQTRQAEGGPTDFQGKARQTDGPVRYSAPSLVFENESGQRLEGGGFQTIEAYDVLIANLDTTLERHDPPEHAIDALRAFPEGLVTQELAAIMAQNNQLPDREAAERALIELLGAGHARREALADDALWSLA
ncbi:MAG TPA: DsbA family protein [Solirubrobacteraceae bacterium]|jgi:protein-disulfide isomerase-like protein with CxxC motif|nr:DsbA family protein [Solirubrobacteraceae bacterium]